MRAAAAILLGALAALAAPAAAQDDPRFCPNRPSLGTSTCITAPGRVQVELGAVDWQRDRNRDELEQRFTGGDALVRLGLDDRTELQVGWAGGGRIRIRDLATGAVAVARGVGDTTLALRRSLRAPDGQGLSIAVQPFVTLDTGTNGVGDGDWAAGSVIPISYDLSDKLRLGFTTQVAAAVDADRAGRHLAANGIVGLGYDLADALTATGELFVERDNDPGGRVTRAALAGSLAWQPVRGRQLDVLAVAGLNRNTPDLRIALGGALLF